MASTTEIAGVQEWGFHRQRRLSGYSIHCYHCLLGDVPELSVRCVSATVRVGLAELGFFIDSDVEGRSGGLRVPSAPAGQLLQPSTRPLSHGGSQDFYASPLLHLSAVVRTHLFLPLTADRFTWCEFCLYSTRAFQCWLHLLYSSRWSSKWAQVGSDADTFQIDSRYFDFNAPLFLLKNSCWKSVHFRDWLYRNSANSSASSYFSRTLPRATSFAFALRPSTSLWNAIE